MEILRQVSHEMSIFLTFHEKVSNSDQFWGKVRILDLFREIGPKSQHYINLKIGVNLQVFPERAHLECLAT